jgi:hypothetical protein
MNEIDLRDLPKKVTKILTGKTVKTIDFHASYKAEPLKELHLSPRQYDDLEKALKSKNRELKGATFKGVLLKRAS